MRTPSFSSRYALLFLLAGAAPAFGGEPPRRLRVEADRAGAADVVVPLEAGLVHTNTILPLDAEGALVPEDRQVEVVFEHLDDILRGAASDASRVVRLHVALARPELRDAVRKAFARRLGGGEPPAWTFVGGVPSQPGSLLALDAVATVEVKPAGGVAREIIPGFRKDLATFAVLPGGPRVFISGQAENDADLATATRKTLQSLKDSLRTLGLGLEHVVQLKAFVEPIASAEVVSEQMIKFFDGSTAPPLVVVGWKSPATTPIEIELIAAAPGAAASDDRVDYPPLPPLKPSPVFSRSARVSRGSLVYTSGLLGPEGVPGADQVGAIFTDLQALLVEAGTDFRHMAKATYYVSDPAADAALGTLRPKLYDPARPPAASKAVVPGVASPGRGVAIDMIAVGP